MWRVQERTGSGHKFTFIRIGHPVLSLAARPSTASPGTSDMNVPAFQHFGSTTDVPSHNLGYKKVGRVLDLQR
jgi:hypothetical protein